MYYIYKLVFKETDKFYIGQSRNLDARYERHWTSLIKNYHHNKHLQNWFNKYKPKFMGMVILNSYDSEEQCNIEEVKLIEETYEKNFNISKKAQGGDLVSYHPDRDIIAKKHRDNYFKQVESGKREPFKAKYGVENPNYRHGNQTKEAKENFIQ